MGRMLWQEKKKLRKALLSEKVVTPVGRKEAPLGVCLIYPNTYEVGMCNLGFQSVYRLINTHPLAFAERAFLPNRRGSNHRPPASMVISEVLTIESQKRLSSFALLAFSISFEGDYLNILTILDAAKIPLRAAQRRGEQHPLLIAGGVAVSLNPEPLADFFDAFFIGEAEAGFSEVLSLIAQGKQKGQNKEAVLAQLSSHHPSIYRPDIGGCYSKSMGKYGNEYGNEYGNGYFTNVEAVEGVTAGETAFTNATSATATGAVAGTAASTLSGTMARRGANSQDIPALNTKLRAKETCAPVVRAFLRDLETAATYQALLPARGEFSDMFLIEISRGCPQYCHFCAAAHIYKPARFRSLESQKHLLTEGLHRRGKVGLVGTAVSDHPEFKDFLRYLSGHGGKVGVSSLRAERIDAELADLLVACGVDSVAIGCEAASEKLRQRLGKRLSEQRIFEAVATLANSGIKNLRLYFMLGVPDESEADCLAIASLTKELRDCFQKNAHRQEKQKRQGGFGKVTISLNLFIPKAGTPLERSPIITLKEAKRRMALVGNALAKESGITINSEPPKAALVQGLLSQGDRSVGALLLAAHQNGGDWQKVFRENRQQIDSIIHRAKPTSESLPWSFLKSGA